MALSELVGKIKANSSGWLKEQPPANLFAGWQTGYSAFSIDSSSVGRVADYIIHQQEHHHKKTFKEELIGILHEAGIEYDERYLWD